MSDAASAHPALKPCGFAKGELIDLNAKHFQQPVWSSYFFTNVPGSANLPDGTQKFSPRNDLAVNEVRCGECGKTIGEHLNQAQQPSAGVEALLTEVKTLLVAQASRPPASDRATSTNTETTASSSVGTSARDKQIKMYLWKAFVPAPCGSYDPTLRVMIIQKLGTISNLTYTTRWIKKDGRLGVELDFHVKRENGDDLFAALSPLCLALEPTSQWEGKQRLSSRLLHSKPPTHYKNDVVQQATSGVGTVEYVLA